MLLILGQFNVAGNAIGGGMTPACTGKSFPIGGDCDKPWDDPRVYGEEGAPGTALASIVG